VRAVTRTAWGGQKEFEALKQRLAKRGCLRGEEADDPRIAGESGFHHLAHGAAVQALCGFLTRRGCAAAWGAAGESERGGRSGGDDRDASRWRRREFRPDW